MKVIYSVLLIFSCNLFLPISTNEGRPPVNVPVYYPPYEPIDMEQFKAAKGMNEMPRRIPLTFQEALKMVRRQKMQSCVALIICTLSCDPQSYGPAGDETYNKLIHFNHLTNSTELSGSLLKDIALFKEAETNGLTHRNHCDLCSADYPRCRRQIEDLLKTFLNFDIHD